MVANKKVKKYTLLSVHLFFPLSLPFGRPVWRLLPKLDLSFEEDFDIIG